MNTEEIQKALDNKFSELSEQMKGQFATKEEFNQFNEKIENLKQSVDNMPQYVTDEKFQEYKDFADKLSNEIQALKEQGKGNKDPMAEFHEKLKETAGQVKEKANSGNHTPFMLSAGDYDLKAAGDMSLTGNITSGQIPQADRVPGVVPVPRRRFTLRDVASVGSTSSNLIEWVEQLNRDGSAAMTAEGSPKSQVDFDLVVKNASVKKITAYVKVTTEMLDDIARIQSIINTELNYQVMLKEEKQLLNGDGTGQNLNGVINQYAQPLDLTALDNTLDNPNRYDALNAALIQIEENMEGMAQPNAIFMRPSDVYVLTNGIKATDNQYVLPNAGISIVDGMPNIMGVPIIKSNSITSGNYLAGDFNWFNIVDRQNMDIQLGLDGNDFTNNYVTIRAEKRLATYVADNYKEGFVHDSFDDSIAFLSSSIS